MRVKTKIADKKEKKKHKNNLYAFKRAKKEYLRMFSEKGVVVAKVEVGAISLGLTGANHRDEL